MSLHMLPRETEAAAAEGLAPRARHCRFDRVCILASSEGEAADEVESSSAFFRSGLVECRQASLAR